MSPRSRPGAFTVLELIIVLVILAVLSTIAAPTMLGVIQGSQNSAAQILLLHVNTDAFALAAADGDGQPTYTDYATAAAEVYYPTGATASPIQVSSPAGSPSTTFGVVSITVINPGATQVAGLAMLSSTPGESVYLRATASPGATPATWQCVTSTASSLNASSAIGSC